LLFPHANRRFGFCSLTVEYSEKYYAAGKIPGGFIKRETKPKDREILVSRIIDRPMRPLFHKEFGREIQIVPTCISADQINPPDVIAANAASAAIHISDIPFDGPVGCVRVALVEGSYILNPTYEQIDHAKLEIVVAGTAQGITMVEGGSHEASEEEMIQAIEMAREPISQICSTIEELRRIAGKEKLAPAPFSIELNNKDEIRKCAYELLSRALFTKIKQERAKAVSEAISAVKEKFADDLDEEIQMKLFQN